MSARSRNGPCPCASGVKYKKCCLPKDEAARTAQPPRARIISHRGRMLTISGNPSTEALDQVADYFERKESGEGFAAQLMRFSQPLIKAAGGDLEIEKIEKAMSLGMIFWNMAISGEEPEAMLTGPLKYLVPAGKDGAEFREVAIAMVERHRQMFPALHVKRSERCVSTET